MSAIQILIVDDDSSISGIVAEVLGHVMPDAHIIEVHSIAAAKKAAAVTHFDSAIVDYNLEDGTAPELVKLFSEQKKPIPCVVLTGNLDFKVTYECSLAGAVSCLSKDFDPMIVGELLRKIIEDSIISNMGKENLEKISDALRAAKHALVTPSAVLYGAIDKFESHPAFIQDPELKRLLGFLKRAAPILCGTPKRIAIESGFGAIFNVKKVATGALIAVVLLAGQLLVTRSGEMMRAVLAVEKKVETFELQVVKTDCLDMGGASIKHDVDTGTVLFDDMLK